MMDPVRAKEETVERTVLEAVHVVAAPIIEANPVDAFAAQKTLVTQEQMEDLNAHDLQTALRQISFALQGRGRHSLRGRRKYFR